MDKVEKAVADIAKLHAQAETEAIFHAMAVTIRLALLEIERDRNSDLTGAVAARLDGVAAEMKESAPEASGKLALMSLILRHTSQVPEAGN